MYTDQNPPKKARQFISSFIFDPPFNEFDIKFVIVKASNKFLRCSEKQYYKEGTSRTITSIVCDETLVKRDAAIRGFDHIFIISDSVTKEGRANAESIGGSIAVGSTHDHSGVCQHEFMHLLGFVDEYFCPKNTRYALNLARISPKHHYDSDQQARSKHSHQIPWYEHIKPSILITSSQKLGTPSSVNERELGLFPNPHCLEEGINYIWKPRRKQSIMENSRILASSYGPIVRSAMKSLGISHDPGKIMGYEDIDKHLDKQLTQCYDKNPVTKKYKLKSKYESLDDCNEDTFPDSFATAASTPIIERNGKWPQSQNPSEASNGGGSGSQEGDTGTEASNGGGSGSQKGDTGTEASNRGGSGSQQGDTGTEASNRGGSGSQQGDTGTEASNGGGSGSQEGDTGTEASNRGGSGSQQGDTGIEGSTGYGSGTEEVSDEDLGEDEYIEIVDGGESSNLFSWITLLAVSISAPTILLTCANCYDVWIFAAASAAWLVGELITMNQFRERADQIREIVETNENKQLASLDGAYKYSKASADAGRTKQVLAAVAAIGFTAAAGVAALGQFASLFGDPQLCSGLLLGHQPPNSKKMDHNRYHLQKIIQNAQNFFIPSAVAQIKENKNSQEILLTLGLGAAGGTTMAILLTQLGLISKAAFKGFVTPVVRMVVYLTLAGVASLAVGEIGSAVDKLEKDASVYKKLHNELKERIKKKSSIEDYKEKDANENVRISPPLYFNNKNIDRNNDGIVHTAIDIMPDGIIPFIMERPKRMTDTVTETSSSQKSSSSPFCVMVDKSYKTIPDPKCSCKPNCLRPSPERLLKKMTKKGKFPPVYIENIIKRHKSTYQMANGNFAKGKRIAISMKTQASEINKITDKLKNKVNETRIKKRKQPIPFKKLEKRTMAHIFDSIKKRLSTLPVKQRTALLSGGVRKRARVRDQASGKRKKTTAGFSLKRKKSSSIIPSTSTSLVDGKTKLTVEKEAFRDISQNSKWIKGDISRNSNKSIFKIISKRYLRSVYPRMLDAFK